MSTPKRLKSTVGFAGLGAMGGGMAQNLVTAGWDVTGFDVDQPRVDSFVKAGGTAARSAKEAAEKADFFVSMVADAAQTSSLLLNGDDAVVKGLGLGKTVIICSTIPPAFLLELRSRLDEAGRPDIRLLDCPVSGGPIRAANGTLSIFESGPDTDLDGASQVLQAMSGNLYRMGDIGAGAKTKTIHQLLAAVNIVAVSEALGLAATVGLNTQAVVDHVNSSDGASFMFENRASHMLKNDWHPYSALAIIQKDARIVTDTARRDHCPLPLVSTAEQLFFQAEHAGLLRLDDAALVQLYLPKSQPDLVSVTAAQADVNMTKSHQVSQDTVADLLAGIHLAGSVEGMAFCKHLGVDRKIMYEIVSKAAGWSAIFTRPDTIRAMLERDRWSLADCPGAEEVGKKLSEAVEKCRLLQYPCLLATIALQQYFFAGLVRKEIGKQDRGGHS